MQLTTSFDVRHPVAMAWARFVLAVWMVLLTALLCSIGDWWGTVLLVPAGLALWIGWRVLRSARN